jgi:hypothetical protein
MTVVLGKIDWGGVLCVGRTCSVIAYFVLPFSFLPRTDSLVQLRGIAPLWTTNCSLVSSFGSEYYPWRCLCTEGAALICLRIMLLFSKIWFVLWFLFQVCLLIFCLGKLMSSCSFFEVSFVGRSYHRGLELLTAGVLVLGSFLVFWLLRGVLLGVGGQTGQRPVYTCVVRVVIYLNITL